MVYIPTHGFLAAFLADSSEYDTAAVGHFLLKWVYTRYDFSNSHATEIVVWSREKSLRHTRYLCECSTRDGVSFNLRFVRFDLINPLKCFFAAKAM